jgi:hypothetical protein
MLAGVAQAVRREPLGDDLLAVVLKRGVRRLDGRREDPAADVARAVLPFAPGPEDEGVAGLVAARLEREEVVAQRRQDLDAALARLGLRRSDAQDAGRESSDAPGTPSPRVMSTSRRGHQDSDDERSEDVRRR